jgi:alpha-tubulin suppressor-like RCC1 family protein
MRINFKKLLGIALVISLCLTTVILQPSFTSTAKIVAVKIYAIDEALLLKSDGKVYAFKTTEKVIPNLSNITAIETSFGNCLALKKDGTVWAWGSNDKGQVGIGTRTEVLKPVQVKGLKNITQIASGKFHMLAVDKDGSVWGWGCNRSGQLGNTKNSPVTTPVKITVLGKVKKVDGNFSKTIALYADGTVGEISKLQNSDTIKFVKNESLKNIVDITTDFYCYAALDKKGNVWVTDNPFIDGYGYTQTKQVKALSGSKRILASGDDYGDSILSQKKDGTSILWGMGGDPSYTVDCSKSLKSTMPSNAVTFFANYASLAFGYIDNKGEAYQWDYDANNSFKLHQHK